MKQRRPKSHYQAPIHIYMICMLMKKKKMMMEGRMNSRGRPSSSCQTLIVLIIFMVFESSSVLVVNSSVQDRVDEIAQDASSALDQAKSTLANVTNRLLHAVASDEEAFLAAHNKARQHAGEAPLEWDEKLASYARQYAESRSGDCQMIHSDGPYGENIFWGGGNQWKAKDMVALWVKEHKFYDRATMKCVEGRMCGHYTQVVWRDTSRMGCARIQCDNGDTLAVCSYDPPGNYIGENPFTNHIDDDQEDNDDRDR